MAYELGHEMWLLWVQLKIMAFRCLVWVKRVRR